MSLSYEGGVEKTFFISYKGTFSILNINSCLGDELNKKRLH